MKNLVSQTVNFMTRFGDLQNQIFIKIDQPHHQSWHNRKKKKVNLETMNSQSSLDPKKIRRAKVENWIQQRLSIVLYRKKIKNKKRKQIMLLKEILERILKIMNK